MDIKEFIIEESKKLNIDIIGFTNSEPLSSLSEYLEFKKRNNMTTEFEEENLEKRIDPTLSLPTCKSIITIGMSYNTGYKPDRTGKEFYGKLSKSSWGKDYHFVLKNKMEDLVGVIEKQIDFEYEIYVDTGPLVDREIARKSGIGNYGKNCSIINEDYGSFIFIGYILVDFEIDSDEIELEDICGDCNKCIDACPTKALEGPYRFNGNKCISYLTQTKEKISVDLREKMGKQIYGCDICQTVCPKNKNILKSKNKDFIPSKTQGYVDIFRLFSMSNREFKNEYGHLAGSWRGKNIFKRNGIIALGNIKSQDSLDFLKEVLDENDERLNDYIIWAIDKIENTK